MKRRMIFLTAAALAVILGATGPAMAGTKLKPATVTPRTTPTTTAPGNSPA